MKKKFISQLKYVILSFHKKYLLLNALHVELFILRSKLGEVKVFNNSKKIIWSFFNNLFAHIFNNKILLVLNHISYIKYNFYYFYFLLRKILNGLNTIYYRSINTINTIIKNNLYIFKCEGRRALTLKQNVHKGSTTNGIFIISNSTSSSNIKYFKSVILQNILLKGKSKINIPHFYGSKSFNTLKSVLFTSNRDVKVYLNPKIKNTLNTSDLEKKNREKHLILLGNYEPLISDIIYLKNFKDKIKRLNSKYIFNPLLSKTQLINYNFTKKYSGNGNINYKGNTINLNSLYKYLKSFFISLSTLCSKPILNIYQNKIRICLFYYVLPSHNKLIQVKTQIKTQQRSLKSKILQKNLLEINKNISASYKETNKNIFNNLCYSNTNTLLKNIKLKLNEFIIKWKKNIELINSRHIPPLEKYFYFKEWYPTIPLDIQNLLRPHYFNPFYSNKFVYVKEEDIQANKSFSNIKNIKLIPTQNTHTQNILLRDNKISIDKKINKSLTENITALSEINSNDNSLTLHSLKKSLQSVKPQTQTQILNTQESQNCINVNVINTNNYSIKIDNEIKGTSIVALNKNKFKYLLFFLEKLFKKTIILDLIRIKYPYHESNILAQILASNSKTKNFRIILKNLLSVANIKKPSLKLNTQERQNRNTTFCIPSYISGLKIKLSGRLITQKIVPRFTVQSYQIGSIGRGKTNFINSSRIILKNKRGVFSFKVITSHIFNTSFA